MIDTHVHLNDDSFKNNLDEIIFNAKKSGVNKMIVIGYDKKTSYEAVRIANKYENIYASIGLHPSEVSKETDRKLHWLEELVSNEKVIAIGEIGYDLYWDKTYLNLQIEMFETQIEFAKKHNLPIIVHSREAIQLTYDTINKYDVKGIIHCFSGSFEMAEKFIDNGFLLGIGGVLTFKNSKLRDVVEKIGLQYIVTETDAPYLAPVPYRGKLNKPEYIPIILEEISRIKQTDSKSVEKIVDENVYKMFKI